MSVAAVITVSWNTRVGRAHHHRYAAIRGDRNNMLAAGLPCDGGAHCAVQPGHAHVLLCDLLLCNLGTPVTLAF